VSEERPYDATPARRERARREGNVARSRELAGIASYAAALGATALIVAPLGAAAAAALAGGSSVPVLAWGLVPLAAAAGGGSLGALAQGGFHLGGLRCSFAALAPLAGLRRIAGGEALVGGGRAAAAFAAVCAAVMPFVGEAVGAAAAPGGAAALTALAAGAALRACAAAAVVGALFALGDYALARRRWLRGLRMTFAELKRELREQDGDPQAKLRRRALHRAFARGNVARTRDASFVVVNPTHVAVALRYAPPEVPVPQVLVRAADDAARAVRALAERAGIPVVTDVALARLLFRCGEVGRPIPAESFVAVATAIAALVRAGLLR
jgi:flagellar biosynthesis protein FlhB